MARTESTIQRYNRVRAEREAAKTRAGIAEAELEVMETDRDELLERLNTHECAGPVDIFLENRLEEANRTLAAVREDFENLEVQAAGYESQRDEAREDLQNMQESLPPELRETRCRLVTGSNPSEQIQCSLGPDHNGDCYAGEPNAQTFAPGTIPKFQFDEAIRQRNTARNERDAARQALDEVSQALGAARGDVEEVVLEATRLETELDESKEEVSRLRGWKRNLQVRLDISNEQRDAAYQGSEPQSQEEITRLKQELIEMNDVRTRAANTEMQMREMGEELTRIPVLTTQIAEMQKVIDGRNLLLEQRDRARVQLIDTVKESSRLEEQLRDTEAALHVARAFIPAGDPKAEIRVAELVKELHAETELRKDLEERLRNAMSVWDGTDQQRILTVKNLDEVLLELHQWKRSSAGLSAELEAMTVQRDAVITGDGPDKGVRVALLKACRELEEMLLNADFRTDDHTVEVTRLREEVENLKAYGLRQVGKHEKTEKKLGDSQRRLGEARRVMGIESDIRLAGVEKRKELDAEVTRLEQQVTALQALKASDMTAISLAIEEWNNWKSKYEAAERELIRVGDCDRRSTEALHQARTERDELRERLDQAIGHIDSLTDLLTGDAVSIDPADAARRIKRKYMRDETPGGEAILGPDPETERVRLRPQRVVGIDLGREDETGLTTWLSPSGPCTVREDGLHYYTESRHRDPYCGACDLPFTQEQPSLPNEVRVKAGYVEVVYRNRGMQTWNPPRGECQARGLIHSPDVTGVIEQGIMPSCVSCGVTYVMNRVEYREPDRDPNCFCGGDPAGHIRGVPDFCVANSAREGDQE